MGYRVVKCAYQHRQIIQDKQATEKKKLPWHIVARLHGRGLTQSDRQPWAGVGGTRPYPSSEIGGDREHSTVWRHSLMRAVQYWEGHSLVVHAARPMERLWTAPPLLQRVLPAVIRAVLSSTTSRGLVLTGRPGAPSTVGRRRTDQKESLNWRTWQELSAIGFKPRVQARPTFRRKRSLKGLPSSSRSSKGVVQTSSKPRLRLCAC